MRRKTFQPPEPAKSRFAQVLEEGRANALRGKKIAVFVDDCDYETEAFLLEHALFQPHGIVGEAVKYSSLFSGACPVADILFLRSSRDFSFSKDELKAALVRLREMNQDSTIILCAYDPSVFRFAAPLLESRIIDHLDETLAGDLRVLTDALEAKGRK
jgi:hypothetical protein